MNEQPILTILITVFNSQDTLDRCFHSINEQTYSNFKIVCVSDCPTDNSMLILKKWQNKFGKNKFTLVQNEKNLGVSKSSNIGLNLIFTKYTARIDSDDWWDKEKLEKQIKFLENNQEYGIIGSNYINVYKGIYNKMYAPESDSEIKGTIGRKNPFGHSTVVYQTDLAKKIGGYSENIKYGSDYELWMKFFVETKFYNFQDFLCYREISDSGISIFRNRERTIQCIKTRVKYIKKYRLSLFNYLHLLPIIISLAIPENIKKIKRKMIGL
jgi:glycosyltransferase involved in cell wall biosynthesis